jgi:predicted O-linked N-acetylglucosamine transferase (SPINDLY family)
MRPIAQILARAFTLAKTGDLSGARNLCTGITQTAPDNPDNWFLLAAINEQLGLNTKAISAYRKCLQLNPDNVDAYNNLGAQLEKAGLIDDARNAYHQAVTRDPRCAAAHYNYGNILRRSGNLTEAIQSLQKAAQLQPTSTQICLDLAHALKTAARFSEASATLQKIIGADKGCFTALNLLGNILQIQGQPENAIKCYREALERNPDYAEAYCNMGSALLAQGCAREAKESYAKAVQLKPDWAGAHSNLLLADNYYSINGDAIFEAHRDWGIKYCPGNENYDHKGLDQNPDRLGIGYISPDFRNHSVTYFIESILSNHDNSRVNVFCYADVAAPDKTTARLQRLNLHWRNIYKMPDKAVADMINQDRIHILVDLAGHTANNRLPVFDMKPAPIQISYLGYPNTTGMPSMDYRLTDAYADLQDIADSWHTEILLRLPNGFLCYTPPAEAPSVAPPPCLASGHICLGSFNNLAKVTPEIIGLWSRTLHAIPASRLVMKNSALSDETVKERCYSLFKEQGIERNRVDFSGQTKTTAEHLHFYQHIDIALDTFPYNGTTTTCEALWMGVPVITLAGTLHAGRVGGSILSQLGLDGLIADDADEFLQVVAKLAADQNRLVELRSSLRGLMLNSSLCDATRFTQNIENTYREVWDKYSDRL